MPKRWKRTILYGGYLLLITLPLLEIGVRMWGYSARYIYDPIYTSFGYCQLNGMRAKYNQVATRLMCTPLPAKKVRPYTTTCSPYLSSTWQHATPFSLKVNYSS